MNKSTGNGVGLGTLLTIVFVVLKLCKVIDWNWWWVLSPLWIPLGMAVVIIGCIVLAVQLFKK